VSSDSHRYPAFRATRSYLSTAAKHGLGFFDALVMLAGGEPWMPTAT
jgi:transposase